MKRKTPLTSSYLIIAMVTFVAIAGFYYYSMYTKPVYQTSTPPTSLPPTIKDITDTTIQSTSRSWKTYTSKSLGFSIKYPPNEVIVYKVLTGDGVVFTFPEYKNTHLESLPSTLQILSRGKAGDDPLDAASAETPSETYGKKNLGEYETVKLNNGYGIHIIRASNSQYVYPGKYYLTDKDNKGFVVKVDANSDINENIDILTEMIKTLEFTR